MYCLHTQLHSGNACQCYGQLHAAQDQATCTGYTKHTRLYFYASCTPACCSWYFRGLHHPVPVAYPDTCMHIIVEPQASQSLGSASHSRGLDCLHTARLCGHARQGGHAGRPIDRLLAMLAVRRRSQQKDVSRAHAGCMHAVSYTGTWLAITRVCEQPCPAWLLEARDCWV
jgi:hypothetical protein